MIKSLIATLICCSTLSGIAYAALTSCPQAVPTNNPGFCASFKTAAQCQCIAKVPASLCTDMNKIYTNMISIYGSVQKACAIQHDTSTQNCIDDWTCYRTGGHDSQGGACSGTGLSCP